LAEGKRVLVHCNAGIGRTGTLLACFLVHQGAKPDEAVRRVRSERPISLETQEQVDVVHQYYRARQKS
jgi:atypical dual specificity phosphatase